MNGAVAGAAAAAFRTSTAAAGGVARGRDPRLRLPALRREERDCFVGASLTAKPSCSWSVA
jgi:hypothetical protein